eukprot:2701249-Amphidinium_carterae.1
MSEVKGQKQLYPMSILHRVRFVLLGKFVSVQLVDGVALTIRRAKNRERAIATQPQLMGVVLGIGHWNTTCSTRKQSCTTLATGCGEVKGASVFSYKSSPAVNSTELRGYSHAKRFDGLGIYAIQASAWWYIDDVRKMFIAVEVFMVRTSGGIAMHRNVVVKALLLNLT